jgi:hypothetical protein
MIFVTINNEVIGIAPNSLQVTETLGQRSTCNLTVRDEFGEYWPAVGQVVTVCEGAASPTIVVFAGTIQDASIRKPYNPGTFREWDLLCTDYNQTADRRIAGEYEWNNVKANDIVHDICNNSLSGEDVSLTYVPVNTGPVIEYFHILFPTVAVALTDLANLAGRVWRIDYLKQLRWDDPAAISPAWEITDSSSNALMGSLRVRQTREQYANTVIVRFGSYLQEGLVQTETAVITGQLFVNCDNPIAAQPTVTVNGTALTVGILNVDTGLKQAYWNADSSSVTFENASPPILTIGDAIVITYTGRVTANIHKQNDAEITARAAIEGNTGVYAVTYNVDSTATMSDADAYATALCARLSALSTVLNFDTDVDYPSVGDRYDIDVTGIATGTYLVRQVRTFDLDGMYLRRTVECAYGPILKDVVDSFKALTGNPSAPTVSAATPGITDSILIPSY